MPRQKKDGKYINIYMDRPLLEKMEQFSDSVGIPKTRIIEDAVRDYLENRGALKKETKDE